MASAYHVVVQSVSTHRRQDRHRSFFASVRHCLDGHRPYGEYMAGCAEARRQRMSSTMLEMRIREHLVSDLNPMVQIVRTLRTPATFTALFNAYNAHAQLGVKTYLQPQGGGAGDAVRIGAMAREVDINLGRDATLAMVSELVSHVGKPQSTLGHRPTRVSDLAGLLGVQPVWGDIALYFEGEPEAKVSNLARSLGCSPRTLLRTLKTSPDALTPDKVRQACMLVRATELLPTDLSLTEIAMECGYSDAAHFSRSFKAATHVAPSVVRQVAYAP